MKRSVSTSLQLAFTILLLSYSLFQGKELYLQYQEYEEDKVKNATLEKYAEQREKELALYQDQALELEENKALIQLKLKEQQFCQEQSSEKL